MKTVSILASALLVCLVLAACGSTASPTPDGSSAATFPRACSVLTADDMLYYLGSHFTATPGADAATCTYHRVDASEDAVLTLVGDLGSDAAASARLGRLGPAVPELVLLPIDEATCSADGHVVAARSGSVVVSVSYTNTSGAPSQCAPWQVSWGLARVALAVLGGYPHPSPFPTN